MEADAISRDSGIASQVQQPNYRFPKKALENAISTVALAILAASVLVLPQPYGVLFSASLVCFCLASSIKTYQAYKENRARAEYKFAMDIQGQDPENSLKWLKKAVERSYTPAILKLAESTNDNELKTTLVTILQLPSHSRIVGRAKIERLQAEIN